MRILVACEFSGRVRDAFTAQGHYAMSVDLLDSETPGEHWTGDVRDVLDDGWDLMCAFPPCTYLANSGARWWPDRQEEQRDAVRFFRTLLDAPIPRICVENPRGYMNGIIRPTQVIQPWMFGHGETKATCLWLRGLYPLIPTDIVPGREARVHKEGPGPDRWKNRSRTYPGIAQAMATQWSTVLTHDIEGVHS